MNEKAHDFDSTPSGNMILFTVLMLHRLGTHFTSKVIYFPHF